VSTVEKKRTILMVEDDPAIAGLVRFRLEREGFTVRHASDGEQALKEFDNPEVPDLVMMDVMLPYRNGYELLGDLRARPALASVPVLMLTSRGREQDVVKGLAGGANDYVLKPFRPAELLARVHKLLGDEG
jgi:DNA-binding response OmpR family regulator